MEYITRSKIKIPKRASSSHKGQNGKVLVIGGSNDYVGAVALAGLAALRSGVDWVTVAVPEKVGWAISCLTPDLVVKKYKGKSFCVNRAAEILTKEEPKYDAVLIGNGIGECKAFVKKYVKETKKKIVIDADGIKAIDAETLKNSIITPHNKELEMLLLNSRIDKATIKRIACETNIQKKALSIKKILKKFLEKNNVILLKGKVDAVISDKRIMYNKTGNPGMTKAGTGDVLAGLCAGFLGQGLSLFQSAINAAYFNGLIGDILLKKKKGYTYLASDMVAEIKNIRKLEQNTK